MKSLVLKDLYNIGHNSKSMLLLLIGFIFILIPSSGPIAYVVTSSILCSMMIITTFAFDDTSKWMRYAMVTPITKKDVVLSKFVVLIIFCGIGAILGMILGMFRGAVFKKIDITSLIDWISMFISCGLSLVGSVFLGSIVILLIFKFGVEKARILSIIAFVIPSMVFIGILQLFKLVGVTLTSLNILVVITIMLILVLLSIFFMYKVSCNIFSKHEF